MMTVLGEGFRPEEDALYFLPLGGAGEIGMNLSLYGHAGKWLMVDLGISFGDDSSPGIEIIMADPAFIKQRSGDLVGIVLTHAHEDHLGAVPYLWEQFGCPVYATPFTAALLRAKLVERGLAGRGLVHEVPLSSRFTAGPFEIELVRITHSVPDAASLVIRTAAGTALHTGDWKFDPAPVIGATEAQLNALKIPTLVVPGNDKTHDRAIGTRAQKCIPNSELYVLFPKDEDIDIVPPKEWEFKDDELAGVFDSFIRRHSA